MADPYSFIGQAGRSVQVRLADVLELRAADPQQRAALISTVGRRDSQALTEHRKNIGGLMEAMLETCTASGEVCGNAAPELAKALEGSPVRLFLPYQSLQCVSRIIDSNRGQAR